MQNQNNAKDQITPIAVTNYRDIRKRFGIKEKNRRGHIYIIGKTGTGKSTLIENMVSSDIKDGKGLALVDPHGDLAENALAHIPKNRIDNVIYFNPGDIEYPIAFNPLENSDRDHHHLITSGIISVFKKIWPEFWGPRLEHILRHSVLTLLDYPQSTLLDIPKLLTDKDFRQGVIKRISNQQVREFWLFEFDKYSAWLRSEAISPILNKVGQFLTSPPLRNIVGQTKNTFDLRKVMDEGKILIVNLSKGKIGEDNCSLLGSMLITQIWLSALGRAGIPEENRKTFYLYVDEIHSFLTLSFADVLSEARKYGISLTFCHQYIDQLDEKIRKAVYGNIGTMISFRVGIEDARFLAGEFYPVFNENDFINLPNYQIYLKMMIDGTTSCPFSAITLPSPENSSDHTEEIIKSSREKYATSRKAIEQELLLKSASQSTSDNPYNQRLLF